MRALIKSSVKFNYILFCLASIFPAFSSSRYLVLHVLYYPTARHCVYKHNHVRTLFGLIQLILSLNFLGINIPVSHPKFTTGGNRFLTWIFYQVVSPTIYLFTTFTCKTTSTSVKFLQSCYLVSQMELWTYLEVRWSIFLFPCSCTLHAFRPNLVKFICKLLDQTN